MYRSALQLTRTVARPSFNAITCSVRTKTTDSKAIEQLETNQNKTEAVTKDKPRRTQQEQDAALMEAYREKFGGDITATFENGKASEMARSVKNNLFRCTNTQIADRKTSLTSQTYNRTSRRTARRECHRPLYNGNGRS